MKKRIAKWFGAAQRRKVSGASGDQQGGPPDAITPSIPRAPEPTHEAQKSIVVLGHCQARPLANCLQALCRDVVASGVELTLGGIADRIAQRDPEAHAALRTYDHILVLPFFQPLIHSCLPDRVNSVRQFPALMFAAYHPDLTYVYLKTAKTYLRGPLGQYNSAIALWGFLNGMSVTETVNLFQERTYETLGYFDYWETSRQVLLEEGVKADFALTEYLERWRRRGCFMHSVNHPKLFVIADVAEALLTSLGLSTTPGGAEYLMDEQAEGPVWPVYPEIGERLGVKGRYHFKIERDRCPPERPVVMLDLREFVEGSFEAFGTQPKEELQCDRMEFEPYKALRTPRSSLMATDPARTTVPGSALTPYSNLPAHHFWNRAVTDLPAEDMDPVVAARFQVSLSNRIATAGSCFAQHISATLQHRGFNYYVTERGDGLTLEEARRRQFGVFSARYGNVYTARQMLQLFDRAFARFVPTDGCWRRADGRYVDPFRPRIEPSGYESEAAVAAARAEHLRAVRHMFETMDVLIFTLGLTEAWRSKLDGAVLPLAPGVAGGEPDRNRYEFVNFRMQEVVADMSQFLTRLLEVNSRANVLLTVSPVPLMATYEPQHVLVSTTYSKSVLRAAASEICAAYKKCDYFPSYEIIAGHYARGRYFEPDLRAITSPGIDHVMRVFLRHYATEETTRSIHPALQAELRAVKDIVCDEEVLRR